MRRAGYQEIERLLSETAGLDPDSLGTKSIANAVDALMEASGIEHLEDYLGALASNRETLEALLEMVLVAETWFFRDRESFNYLRRYVEETGFLRPGAKPLRILSAPCSTGEEPYSIAMALLEAGLPAERLRIDAVDISRKAIETAKKAVYGRGSFRGEGKEPYESYFSGIDGGYRVDPRVSDLIHFYLDNLALPRALLHHEPYDIVFCKNLLIYLTEDGRRIVMANLDRLLAPRGLLFAGNSEVVSLLQHGYRPVKHAMSFACRKDGESLRPAPPAPRPAQARHRPPARAPAKSPDMEEAKREEAPESAPIATSLHEIRALADRGTLHEALKLCERFLGEHPHHTEGYCLMGLIHLALDSLAVAEECFQRVLYLDPLHHEALVHMGLLYEKRGDLAKASIMRERIERSGNKDARGQTL